jgi:energy-coupling factor transport system permease protein
MDLLRSLPLGLYLEQPVTWMHRLDPRIKLVWLMTFLAAPVLATATWRLLLCGLLVVLTLSAQIPLRVWRQQMGWLSCLCLLIFGLTTILPDGMDVPSQPRQPANELAFAQQPSTLPPKPKDDPWWSWNPLALGKATPDTPELQAQKPYPYPQPTDYTYVLFKGGIFTVTRRSLDLAVRASTLLFTLLYSTTLFLLTTAPEEVTAALENWLAPLRRFKVPVTEIALTLTLALRFIPLVLEEVQNLGRSISTRAINWKKLGMRRTAQVWLMVAERLLENLLLRAEQIASAMNVRGFTSPNEHRVEWYQFRFCGLDWFALFAVILLWGARLIWGTAL